MDQLRLRDVSNRPQYYALLALIIVVLIATGLVNSANATFFKRFIGDSSPLLVMLSTGVLGMGLFSLLLRRKWFAIYKKRNLHAALRLAWLIIIFTAVAIYVDLQIAFPEDMNIPFPESMFFYPAIAFLVEIVFHVLPITLLLLVFTSIFSKVSFKKILWICLTIVALLEPTFQAFFMGTNPGWAIGLVWINLFLFNLTQLYVFVKHDFISMFLFRLIYYAIWHVAWGYLRLEWLF